MDFRDFLHAWPINIIVVIMVGAACGFGLVQAQLFFNAINPEPNYWLLLENCQYELNQCQKTQADSNAIGLNEINAIQKRMNELCKEKEAKEQKVFWKNYIKKHYLKGEIDAFKTIKEECK